MTWVCNRDQQTQGGRVTDDNERETTNDEVVGKVFIVVGPDTRRCLICDRVFTPQGAAEHSGAVCHPSAGDCEFDRAAGVEERKWQTKKAL